MSTSTLYLLNKNLWHFHHKEFQNATLFKPIIKLALEEEYKEKLKAGTDLETLFNKKNDSSVVKEDRILWWLTNEKIFEIKDMKLVRDSIEYFLACRLLKPGLIMDGKLLDKAIEFYNDIIQEFDSIIEGDNISKSMKYFIFNADSRKDHISEWFTVFDKDVEVPSGVGRMNKGAYVTRDISKLDYHVTDFVKILSDNDWELIGNEEFDKYDYSE